MLAGFGKSKILLGSGSHCDLSLNAEDVAPEHASIEHVGAGQLVFTDLGHGPSFVGAQSLPAKSSRTFDFRTPFRIGKVAVPLAHPSLTLMLLGRGQLPETPGQLVFGRDPARCHVVVHHPSVSGRHASVTREPFSVIDHGSTSGTWLAGRRLAPDDATPLSGSALIALGPIPFAGELLQRLFEPEQAVMTGAALAQARTAVQQAVAPLIGASAAGAGAPPTRGARYKTIIGQVDLSPSQDLEQSIGRTPDNDIVIEHPQISSHHALLHRHEGKLFIEDRGSANGTFVRGQRIPKGQRIAIAGDEKIFVGPMPLRLQSIAKEVEVVVDDQERWAGRPVYEIEACGLSLQVADRDRPSELKTLLDGVSFKALPGDFIALMGPSGAGKTTLLLALNGYLPPSAGQVLINGEDLYSIYDALRGSIGYVPQDDIVHPELTVWEAVRYSAKMRLPPDYAEEEIERRVQATLLQLGLESVKHLQIGKPEKKVLSGGQRKRVNIAMELVTDPVLMFLDEPTSGLAADDTAALITLLADLAKSTGKTIITTIHQPARDEFHKFNLALILGQGGTTLYFGPTHPDAYEFFGGWLRKRGKDISIDNPRDMFDVLKQREDAALETLKRSDATATRAQARALAAAEWHQDYFVDANPTFAKMYSGRREVGGAKSGTGVPPARLANRGQFGLLFTRYFRVKARDVTGTAIMLLQAPIIAVLLAMVFGGQKAAIPYWCLGALQELSSKFSDDKSDIGDLLRNMERTYDHSAAAFFVVVTAVWFGTSNAAREIVSERAVYVRERMVNLGLVNYVMSKFVLLGLVTVIQCACLLGIVFVTLGFNSGPLGFLISLGTLVVTAMNSVALGLLLSTVVTSSEAAMALTPIALIPQVVLGGLMVPMTTNELLRWPMYLMPARWGFQGLAAQEREAIASHSAWVLDIGRSESSTEHFLENGKFHCAQAQIASDGFYGAWGFTSYDQPLVPVIVLGGMMFGLLAIILLVLRRRDRV